MLCVLPNEILLKKCVHTKFKRTWPFSRLFVPELPVVIVSTRVHLASSVQHQCMHGTARNFVNVGRLWPVHQTRYKNLQIKQPYVM